MQCWGLWHLALEGQEALHKVLSNNFFLRVAITAEGNRKRDDARLGSGLSEKEKANNVKE